MDDNSSVKNEQTTEFSLHAIYLQEPGGWSQVVK